MAVRQDDGFSTYVSFANYPSIKLYEKEITPPGVDGGGAVETHTMRNTAWRTKGPKHLKSMDDLTFTAAFATDVYSDVMSAVNENQLITVHFPDGHTLAVWGFITSFKPNQVKEGDQPTAVVTVVCSLQNNSGVEVAPVYA